MNRLSIAFSITTKRSCSRPGCNSWRRVVHKFVIVCSRRTITGATKPEAFPAHLVTSLGLNDKVDVIELDELEGSNPMAREVFSRNALARGLRNADPGDLVMISDVDEFVRPATAAGLAESLGDGRLALALDYYNFKFNYQLVHGEMAVWPGPVVCRMRNYPSAQELRDWRLAALDDEKSYVEDAGWHFSFLTARDDVRAKIDNYGHRENDVQDRGVASVASLIASREGFHDYGHAGSVWAIVDTNSFRCPALEEAVARFPHLLIAGPSDDAGDVNRRIRRVMRHDPGARATEGPPPLRLARTGAPAWKQGS